jgi:NADPH2:quinone reductase
MTGTAARAVRFDRYGGREVLYVDDVRVRDPASGEVLVEVWAAGINPGETNIRIGGLNERFPATFPSGQGSDLAGVVRAVGDDVRDVAVDDEVLGWSWERSSHATHVVVPVTQLVPKPVALDWTVAGSLYVAACTAWAAVNAVDPQPGDTVAVSAASGGVGSIVVQLLVLRGARVLGIASPASARWLTSHGATPIPYDDQLAQRLVSAAPDGIDAFVDLFGPDYVQLAVDLGVPRDRIETTISFSKAKELSTKSAGSVDGSTRQVLAKMAAHVADGRIQVTVEATNLLKDVRDAFAQLEERHTHGKIALIPRQVNIP